MYVKCLVVIGAFFWFPIGGAAWIKRLKSPRDKVFGLSVLLAIICSPVPKSRWFQQSWLFDQVLRYFRTSVVGQRPPGAGRQTVYGMAPHGIVPFSLGLSAFGGLNSVMSNLRIVTATGTHTHLTPHTTHRTHRTHHTPHTTHRTPHLG